MKKETSFYIRRSLSFMTNIQLISYFVLRPALFIEHDTRNIHDIRNFLKQ